ncbi:MAG: AAA domain-containing protein, partial [Acetobacteraceae bacterium]
MDVTPLGDEAASHAGPAESELPPTRRALSQLIEYLRVLIELADKPVWSLANYNNVILHEDHLGNRLGIRHDLTDASGPVYLKIDRLPRTDPPEAPPEAANWLAVSRDPFQEPLIQPLRTTVMPASQAEWLIAEGAVDRDDVTKTLQPKPGEDLRDVVLRMERFPEAKAKVDQYVARAWTEWAEAERPRRETIEIYDRLFSVQEALKLEGADRPLEIVWGMGVARWRVPPNELDHPLVEQLVELELDEAGAILVRPRGLEPIIALKPFAAIENPGTNAVARFARKHFAKLPPDQELSPFVKETFTPILRYAATQLDRSGRYHPDHAPADHRSVPDAGPSLVITDTWVLYARPRSDNFFIADLDRLRKAVDDAAALPGPAAALVTEPSDEPDYVPSIPGITIRPRGSGGADSPASPDPQTERAVPAQYFFPKPFNDEQIAIVERLESPDVEGVVVQGPPGTGKTHTIANIICHYLATGRRVLVTSKSEGALTVLRDQIPEGIRDLAISLLTSEREGLRQLEATVNTLASKIAALNPTPTEREIAESEQRIVELQGRVDRIDDELRAFAEKHLRRIGAETNTGGVLPIELAERIAGDRSRYGWFVDRPPPPSAGEPQFTDAEITAVRLARRTLGADLDYLETNLPGSSDLPDAATLAAIHQASASAARIERDQPPDAPVMSSSEADAVSRAEAILAAVKAIVAVHEECVRAPWLANLFAAGRRYGLDADRVRPLSKLIAALSELLRKRVTMASYAVLTAEDAHAQPGLVAAAERAASGQRPFGLVPWGKSETRASFEAIRILDKPPERPEQWHRVLDVLVWRSELTTAVSQWRALATEFSLPPIPPAPEEAARALQELIEAVNSVTNAVRIHAPVVQAELRHLFPHGLDPERIIDDLGHARRAEAAIASEVLRCRLSSSRAHLEATKEKLVAYDGRITRSIQAFLSGTVGDPDIARGRIADEWARLLRELERVRAQRPHLDTVARVAARIDHSGAPKWAVALSTIPVDGAEDIWTPVDWRDAWAWAQADSYLRAIDGRPRLRELSEQRRVAEDEMRRLFQNVVRLRTLLTLKARITHRVNAALQMFLSAIRGIGTGAGRNASRFRRDARDAMESCCAAIPCWIMPTWRVSESLPASLASFDLVIFDEASQSDIGALPTLLRARKALIVGDDKQVSPTAAFIPAQRLRALQMHYLKDQPFGALMLPGNSLYELALACYPGRRIMLKEHFRCVESIIRFSFQFYPDEIVPVRLPKASERLSPPLIDVHVPHGHKDKTNRNLAEAEAIVAEVARIVGDPLMAGRSIGIISLIGARQAQLIQAMLLERIGEDAYLRHDIACGNSAVFQGKERDIVLLSMVECPATRTSKTALLFQQRFNVALSRARDREYLFHSVTEDMLKPDDLKARVLRYFKNPMVGHAAPGSDLRALCQSSFERDVLARLLKLGYRVQPQVKVGPYSIDLVVEGSDDRRLAIELDGDKYHGPERWAEDLARQRVMERVGWRFWRCWG